MLGIQMQIVSRTEPPRDALIELIRLARWLLTLLGTAVMLHLQP